MFKKFDIPRISTRTNTRYHHIDRVKNKILVNQWKYDLLPSKESMRQAIWRGPNDCGDATSFGYYCSGVPDYDYIEKLVMKHIGKSYDAFYSKMCMRFKGRDRIVFDNHIHWLFGNRFRWGLWLGEYDVVDGLIVKN